MSRKSPKVSIIIVHFKSKRELFACINSIFSSKPKASFEIIIIDNSRTLNRNLFRKFSQLIYVKNTVNSGYGAGNNLGNSHSKGKYLMILNPDTQVLPGTIDNLVKFLDQNKKAAVVSPNLLSKKFKTYQQLGSRTLTPIRGIFALSFLNKLLQNNLVSNSYWAKDLPLDKLREVDVVPGSALMVRKDVFDRVRGFDEKIFLYFDESDLCKRIRDLGWKVYINPKSQVIHDWRPERQRTKFLSKTFASSRFYYFKKHYGLLWATVVEIFARFSRRKAGIILATLIMILFIYLIVVFND